MKVINSCNAKEDPYIKIFKCPLFTRNSPAAIAIYLASAYTQDFMVWIDSMGHWNHKNQWAHFCALERFPLWRHDGVSWHDRWSNFFSLKYTCIIYHLKGNFMLIKNLFETYVWNGTPGEIISKQCRHNDVTNKVEIYVSSKLDILYTVRKEILC